jgi:hypothetical protein
MQNNIKIKGNIQPISTIRNKIPELIGLALIEGMIAG